ncbi:hypothetical protein ABZV34_04670 [Streptomyces sp. NPDC005195]|uniref:hypothetical protein n=1 Tax=Streptomyces sp. NPDC005195 TaxID=3154561 RepID=UPI0033B6256C
MTLSSADLEAGVADDEAVGKKKRRPRADGPKRRSFTPEYKLAIAKEHERLTEPGAKGALLRRRHVELLHEEHEHLRHALEVVSASVLPGEHQTRGSMESGQGVATTGHIG